MCLIKVSTDSHTELGVSRHIIIFIIIENKNKGKNKVIKPGKVINRFIKRITLN